MVWWKLSPVWPVDYIFLLWSHALIPTLNWLFQLISPVLIQAKTLQETCLFRTENRSSVQTSSWPAAVTTSSFAFLTFHNYMPNYPLLGGLVCMADFKLVGSTLAHCLFFFFSSEELSWGPSRTRNIIRNTKCGIFTYIF